MDGICFVHKYIKPDDTGLLLKNKAKRYGYTVKDIQKLLGLSCPQPIYRWFKGFALPSLDNLYALSLLYEIHMEELVVSSRIGFFDVDSINHKKQDKRVLRFAKFIE